MFLHSKLDSVDCFLISSLGICPSGTLHYTYITCISIKLPSPTESGYKGPIGPLFSCWWMMGFWDNVRHPTILFTHYGWVYRRMNYLGLNNCTNICNICAACSREFQCTETLVHWNNKKKDQGLAQLPEWCVQYTLEKGRGTWCPTCRTIARPYLHCHAIAFNSKPTVTIGSVLTRNPLVYWYI